MPMHEGNLAAFPVASKWSRIFWADLAERVGATAVGALLAVVAGSQSGAFPNDPAAWWAVIGVPVAVSLLKGFGANLASPASGPSLLPAPPAPVVEPEPVIEPEPAAKKAAAKRPAKKAAPKPPSD